MEPSPGSWDPSYPRLSPPPASPLPAPTSSTCPVVARIPRAVTPARNDDVSTPSGLRRLSPARARSVANRADPQRALGAEPGGGLCRRWARASYSPELPSALPWRPNGRGSGGLSLVTWGWKKRPGSRCVAGGFKAPDSNLLGVSVARARCLYVTRPGPQLSWYSGVVWIASDPRLCRVFFFLPV